MHNKPQWTHAFKQTGLGLTLVAGIALLSACGSTGGTKTDYWGSPEEQKVAQRAEQRWALLSAGEYDKAWEFFTPGHKRFEDKAAFGLRMRQKRVEWQGAQVQVVDCVEDGSSCDVTIKIDYVYRSPRPMVGAIEATTELNEKWVKLKGKWYYLPSNLKQKLLK